MPPSDDDLRSQQQFASAFIQTISRDLENMQKKAKEASSEGGGFHQLNKIFEGMTKSLVGPVGLAAAMYQVGKSLESFAVGRVQLQAFSKDIGLSVPLINAMGRSLDDIGVSAAGQTQTIQRLGTLIGDLAAHGMGSKLATVLRETAGTGEIARQHMQELEQLTKTSRTNADQAVKDLIVILNRGSNELKFHRDADLELQKSQVDALQHTQAEMNKVYVADIEAAEKWHKRWGEIGLELSNYWARLYDGFTKTVGKIPQETMDHLIHGVKEGEGTKAPDVSLVGGAASGEWLVNAVKNFSSFRSSSIWEKLVGTEPVENLPDWLKNLNLNPASALLGPSSLDRFKGGGPASFGERFSGDSFMSGAAASADGKELIATTKESGKTLLDIRNLLMGSGGGLRAATGPGGFRPPQGSGAGPGGGRFGRRSGGGGGPDSDAPDTSTPVGSLAEQRTGFMKELNDDPELKNYAIDAMQHEGGVQSNMEQLFNYAAMRKMSIRQALHSGQYGPVNTGQISGRISDDLRRRGDAALGRVGAGSNITDYATDQGMAGDPNFAKYMADQQHYNMHKVQGAWFSAHGERGIKWAEQQRELASHRESLDKTQSAPKTEAEMNATVSFKDMPSWVKSSVDSNGKFKNLRVTRSTPQAGKASSPQGDTQPWSYE